MGSDKYNIHGERFKDFWQNHQNCNPTDEIHIILMPTDNKNYAQALEKVCENEEILSKILSQNEKRLLNEMINAYDTLTGETAVSKFTSGFKIGARFMLNILDNDTKSYFKD